MKSLRPTWPRDRFRGLFATIALLGALLAIAPAQSSAGGFFGVVPQFDITTEDFENLGAAKAGQVRIGVNWPALQRTQQESDEIRTQLDDEFGQAAANKIDILPFINNTPDWVRPDEDLPPIESAADRKAYKNFVRLLVERYGPDGVYWTDVFPEEFPGEAPRPVKTWQIWNEPSSPASFEPKPNAKEYGALVLLAEKAIHQVDPSAKVMLAGIFYSPSNNGPIAPRFTRKLMDVNGVKNAVDSAAVHAYGKNADEVGFQINAVSKALKQSGAQDKELFVTETGWSTGNGQGPLYVSQEGQAKRLTDTFKLAQKEKNKWNLGGIYWFSLRDLPPDGETPCFFCANTGLFKANRTPKPAWGAFKNFTKP